MEFRDAALSARSGVRVHCRTDRFNRLNRDHARLLEWELVLPSIADVAAVGQSLRALVNT